MKITKQKLISLIKEVISEQSTPPEIQKAVQSDAELETLLTAMASRISELETELEQTKNLSTESKLEESKKEIERIRTLILEYEIKDEVINKSKLILKEKKKN